MGKSVAKPKKKREVIKCKRIPTETALQLTDVELATMRKPREKSNLISKEIIQCILFGLIIADNVLERT